MEKKSEYIFFSFLKPSRTSESVRYSTLYRALLLSQNSVHGALLLNGDLPRGHKNPPTRSRYWTVSSGGPAGGGWAVRLGCAPVKRASSSRGKTPGLISSGPASRTSVSYGSFVRRSIDGKVRCPYIEHGIRSRRFESIDFFEASSLFYAHKPYPAVAHRLVNLVLSAYFYSFFFF